MAFFYFKGAKFLFFSIKRLYSANFCIKNTSLNPSSLRSHDLIKTRSVNPHFSNKRQLSALSMLTYAYS